MGDLETNDLKERLFRKVTILVSRFGHLRQLLRFPSSVAQRILLPFVIPDSENENDVWFKDISRTRQIHEEVACSVVVSWPSVQRLRSLPDFRRCEFLFHRL